MDNRTELARFRGRPLARTGINDLMAIADRWDREFSVTERTPPEQIEVSEDALTFGANRVPMDQSGRERLFARAGAPVAYMKNRSINIQMLDLAEHFQQGAFGASPRIVLRNRELFTVLPGTLVELNHAELLAAVAEPLGKDADSLSVSRIDRADGRLELELTSPVKAVEIRRGDVVEAGLHIVHSRFSDEATKVQAFIYRLVCENGMTRRECVSTEGIVRTRKIPVGHPRAKELLTDQIRRLTARTWEQLEPQLGELRSTAERSADARQLLRTWLQRARFSTRTSNEAGTESGKTMMDRVLRAWREWGSEDSVYGAVNALTHVATHDLDLSARQRRTLSLLGGLLAFSHSHLCPRCFAVLADRGDAPEKQQAGQLTAA